MKMTPSKFYLQCSLRLQLIYTMTDYQISFISKKKKKTKNTKKQKRKKTKAQLKENW